MGLLCRRRALVFDSEFGEGLERVVLVFGGCMAFLECDLKRDIAKKKGEERGHESVCSGI